MLPCRSAGRLSTFLGTNARQVLGIPYPLYDQHMFELEKGVLGRQKYAYLGRSLGLSLSEHRAISWYSRLFVISQISLGCFDDVLAFCAVNQL